MNKTLWFILLFSKNYTNFVINCNLCHFDNFGNNCGHKINLVRSTQVIADITLLVPQILYLKTTCLLEMKRFLYRICS